MTKEEFIEKVGESASALYGTYDILPSVVIAQACLESAYGTSELAANAKALFGIKADSAWSGKKYQIQTWEFVNGKRITTYAYFRAYNNWAESIIDHNNFLDSLPRYKNILGDTDYKSVCGKLKADGYATDPEYAKKLIAIIESNNLVRFDKREIPDPETPPCPKQDVEEIIVNYTGKPIVIRIQ